MPAYWSNLVDASQTIGTTDTIVLPIASKRYYLSIQNVHTTANVAVNFAAVAQVNTLGSYQLGPGVSLSFLSAVPVDAVHAISDTASTPLTIKWM